MTTEVPFKISVQDLHELRTAGANHTVLDIREPHEVDMVSLQGALAIPMNAIPDNLEKLPKEGTLVIMCHHGPRSGSVTEWLREQGFDNAMNLAGGIHQWAVEIDPEVGTY
jgi:rhodanese-related sulfurtransferase